MLYTLFMKVLWTSFLICGFDFVLIETRLSFTFNSDWSRTIAEFQVPSQITCVHKCRNLSSKMFYDGDLCICFEIENQENNKVKKKSNDELIRRGILMAPLKMKEVKVNIGIIIADKNFMLSYILGVVSLSSSLDPRTRRTAKVNVVAVHDSPSTISVKRFTNIIY